MGTDFAAVARLLASPARSAVVDALMDGRALTAGELARLAGVRPSTISGHLGDLVDRGLLAVVAAGRHRYYRLASAEVAAALEALSRICPATPVRSLRQSATDRSLRLARMCYDHVAGALGVALLDQMLAGGWLVGDPATAGALPRGSLEVTEGTAGLFARLGVDVADCRRSRRHLARPCLDWSERRMHLAGSLGAATATAMIDRGWLRRASSGRGLRITQAGGHGLGEVFGIDAGELRPS